VHSDDGNNGGGNVVYSMVCNPWHGHSISIP